MSGVNRLVSVRVERLPHGQDLPLPEPSSAGSAGADLRAAIGDALRLAPGQRRLVPTGLRLAVPSGWEAQVRPRSGLALHHGLTVLNAPGTIDSDYRGEVGVVLINLGQDAVTIEHGDRIAQLVVAPVGRIQFEEAEVSLAESGRGEGGFGSTGRD